MPIRHSGRYAVTVYHGGDSETSESVLITEIAKFPNQLDFPENADDNAATPRKESTDLDKTNAEPYQPTLPVIQNRISI